LLDPAGKSQSLRPEGRAHKLIAAGRSVLVVDVTGMGEVASTGGDWYNKRFGSEGRNATIAYLLGESILRMRSADVIDVAQIAGYLARGDGGGAPKSVDLIAVGELGPPALHAAALAPELFNKVRIERSLTSFTSIVETPVVENQWVHMIHGALRVYDLPDLAVSLGDKLELVEPIDASGRVITEEK
jgi:hypothetical protein